jgi:imidazole glycerol-phosphate synthase subunit HisH
VLPEEDVLATGTYGGVFPTLVGRDNVLGAQFHPEKSQRAGIELLDAFAQWRP